MSIRIKRMFRVRVLKIAVAEWFLGPEPPALIAR
jgi:hypothetical protein